MSAADRSQIGASSDPHAAGAGDQAATSADVPAVADGEDQRLDGLLPVGISPLAAKGPGRPKGAKNRRTDLVAAYLVERFGDPLTASMATAGMPLRELVTELRKIASDCGMKLGASVMDIARFQRDCRNDATPYIHAKRAPETAKGDPVVPVIGIGRVEQHNTTVVVGGAAGKSLEDALAEKIAETQQVIDHDADMSHDEMSHDEPND